MDPNRSNVMENGSGVSVEPSTEIDLDGLMEELDCAVGVLPERAIRKLQPHRELAIPRLIQAIRDSSAQARAGELVEGNDHFFALFLLTEFRAHEALPAILEAVTLPGELPFDLFGGGITEMLARVLAVLAGDRLDLLDELIGNRALNEYVRWEAAQAYEYLVRDGRVPLDEAVQHLRKHLAVAIAESDTDIAGPLICTLESLFPLGALQDAVLAEIEEAYRLNIADPGLIHLDDVKRAAQRAESKRFEHLGPTAVEDTVEELRHWAAFNPHRDNLATMRPTAAPLSPRVIETPREDYGPPVGTIVLTGPHVGRNDPCPCGSGKKFKKCCGAHH